MALSMFMNPFQHPFHVSSRSLFTDLDDMLLYERPFNHHHYCNHHLLSSSFYPDYPLFNRAPMYYRTPPVRRVVYRPPPIVHVSQPRYLSLIADPFSNAHEVAPLKRHEATSAKNKEEPLTVTNTPTSDNAAAVSTNAASPAATKPAESAATAITPNRPRLSEKLESLWAMKTLSDLKLSVDGTAFELRMPIAPHATISNVAMNVLRNTHDADRKLQVTVDTETREQVALFESWPMVSVSKHSASRTVSLPAEAKVEGVAVVLIEAKTSNESSQGEAQERELLIKIPREVAANAAETEVPSASYEVQEDSATAVADDVDTNAAIMSPSLPQIEQHHQEDDTASTNMSEVTVEDVNDETENN